MSRQTIKVVITYKDKPYTATIVFSEGTATEEIMIKFVAEKAETIMKEIFAAQS